MSTLPRAPLPATLPGRFLHEQLWPAMRRTAATAWRSLRQSAAVPLLAKRTRRLRVAETLSLGDKRFVSILEVDGQSFLLGGGGSGVSLLATLTPPEQTSFEHRLRQSFQDSARDEVR